MHPDRVLVSEADLDAADGDPFLGMVIAGRFAVLARLGAGSMGTVYRARQEGMGRDVALKIVRSERLVDPQAKGRFRQEAHATSLLTSPHTVTVFDFGEVELSEGDDPHGISGSLFLAMELLDGTSLGTRLKERGPVEAPEAVRIVRDALLSLAEAHDKGVIHRDLKPDNLVITTGDDGSPLCKVLDFGIAKLLTHQGGIDALETQAGTVFGTPRYMSPEQAQGRTLDARSDVYSLGVILYHMLTGRPPFTDGDAVVVMAHHIKTVPALPSRVRIDLAIPGSLEALLMRVLDKDPGRRPQSARAFIAALDALGPLDPSQTSAEMAAVVGRRPSSRDPRRRMMVAGSVVAALVGVLAAMLVASSGTEGTSSPRGQVARAELVAGAVAFTRGIPDRRVGGFPSAPASGAASAFSDDPGPSDQAALRASPGATTTSTRSPVVPGEGADAARAGAGTPNVDGVPSPPARPVAGPPRPGSRRPPTAPSPSRGYERFDR
ncbi:MAG: serine/threonine-protein kinase [Myxococcota bacterium]